MGTPIFSLNTDVHSEKAAHISYRAKTRSTFLKKKKKLWAFQYISRHSIAF